MADNGVDFSVPGSLDKVFAAVPEDFFNLREQLAVERAKQVAVAGTGVRKRYPVVNTQVRLTRGRRQDGSLQVR